jgi:hypothetical protein
VKCYSGNPLKPYNSAKSRRYSGPTWSGWSPDNVVKVSPAATPQESFKLVDVNTGKPFNRVAGPTAQDTPVETQPSASPSTSPPSVSPSASPTKPTTSTGQQAATLLTGSISECADNNAPYPWPPHKSLNARSDASADGDVWTVNVDATKQDDTVELFVWRVNPVEDWVSPANSRASEAAQYCSLLGR